MRKLWFCIVCLLLGCFGGFAPANAQVPLQMQRTLVPAGTTTYGFIQYLPAEFTTRSDWPLIVYLHGNGENGNGSAAALPTVENQGVAFEIAYHGRKLPAVVLALQAPGAWNVASIDQVISYAVANYRVDANKVCLTGYDSGGTGVVDYLNTYPAKVAAAAPVCAGQAVSMATANTIVASNIPLWVFHAIDDTAVIADASNPYGNGPWATFTRIAAARGATSYGALDGYTNNGTIKTGYTGRDGMRYAWDYEAFDYMKNGAAFNAQQMWTIFPSGGHWIWGQVYENNKLYDWMLGKTKGTSQPRARNLVTPISGQTTYGFIQYLPEDYSSRTDWPLIIFLHGSAERGDSTTNVSTGLPKIEAKGLPNEIQGRGRKIPAVVLAPQAPTSVSTWDPIKVDEIVNYALSHYGVNSKKVTITGLDMGGGGAIDYVNAHQDKLAGALPVCPVGLGNGNGYGSLDFNVANQLVQRNFPFWLVRSKDDTVSTSTDTWNTMARLVAWRRNDGTIGAGPDEFYPTGTTNTVTGYYCDSLQNYSFEVVGQEYKKNSAPMNPKQIWTIYPSSNHAIWDSIYQDDKVYDWLLAQQK